MITCENVNFEAQLKNSFISLKVYAVLEVFNLFMKLDQLTDTAMGNIFVKKLRNLQ